MRGVSAVPDMSSDEELQRYLASGCLDLAVDARGKPVGSIGGYLLQGRLHIGESDVRPEGQRRRMGRRLMQTMLHWGRGV